MAKETMSELSSERILGGALESGLATFAASFLFDHQIRPPSRASSAAAVASLVSFTACLLYRSSPVLYLLFHHVATPKATTLSGKIQTLNQNSAGMRRPLISSGRSSGALGRIEISSSSEASQLTMLATRSRLSSGR